MENKHKIFQNGSTWLRADFHMHTKVDKEFTYDGSNFVNEYVESLKSQDIRIGVITNHNKFCLTEFKELRKQSLKEEIFLLPGVELSVDDGSNGIHCLIIFDYEEWFKNGTDFINQFLDAAFEGKSNRENKNIRCYYNLKVLFDKLNFHRSENRDSFIIMAHVEQTSGFLNELDGGRIQQIGSDKSFRENVLAFQKVRSKDKIKNLKIWFNDKEIAFVEGSDCKVISDVGKAHLVQDQEKKTFIKIGDFNFEAIKYALFDFQNRISQEIPIINNSYIKSAKFIGGKLDGHSINFNNNMNCLIGIRGSGKSSILEAIRYTLDISLGKNSQDDDYKIALVDKFIGGGGKVILEIITKNNKHYTIEKIYNERTEIKKDGERIPDLKIDDNLIKIIYFGQKDLSNTGGDFNEAFIEKFFGRKTIEIKNKIFENNQELIKIINELKIVNDLTLKKDEVFSEIASLKEKLKLFKEFKIDEKLKKQVNFNKDKLIINDSIKHLNTIIQDFREIVIEYKDSFDVFLNYKSEFNSKIFENLSESLISFKNKFEKIIDLMKEAKNDVLELEKIKKKFEVLNNSLIEEFSEVKRKIDQKQINPDDYIKSSNSLNLLNSKLNELNKKDEIKINLTKKLNEQLTELKDLWYQDFSIIEGETKKVNEKKLSISIEVEFKGNKDAFKFFLIDFLKGSNIQSNNIDKIVNLYKDTIEIFYDLNKKDSQLTDILKGGIQFINLKNFIEKQLESFLTFRVPDKYIFKYKGKILQEHSLGQRASALIIFILSMYETDLIMIDQPEDDLDNQSIYKDVIKEICNLKNKTQFIFATHNPNIPVLGDSEQVISCEYYEEKIITKSSSIDDKSTQEEIINIMEGGEDAFNKRKEIYSIWKL